MQEALWKFPRKFQSFPKGNGSGVRALSAADGDVVGDGFAISFSGIGRIGIVHP